MASIGESSTGSTRHTFHSTGDTFAIELVTLGGYIDDVKFACKRSLRILHNDRTETCFKIF